MAGYDVVKTVKMLTGVETDFIMDSEPRKEDALLLALLYTEEHYLRVHFAGSMEMIDAVFTPRYGDIIGYRFRTSNYSLVTYAIKEKLEAGV